MLICALILENPSDTHMMLNQVLDYGYQIILRMCKQGV